MNKILFLSPILDGTGYSHAGIEYIRAMMAAGLDVATLPIKLNNVNGEIPSEVRASLNKSPYGCNICIQHSLPSHWSFDGHFKKNIGLFAWETSSFGNSNWQHYCNLMDEVWVISQHMKESAIRSGVRVPIRVIPHAVDLNKYNKSYKLIERDQENFYFYTIGEFNRRKNHISLIKAFLTEFHPHENVELVIKTSENLDGVVDRIAAGLKLYKDNSYYKKPIVLLGKMSEEQIMELHYSLDCFVSASYGEAFCLPAVDAIGFGKHVIVPNHSAFAEYFNPKVAHLVNSHNEMVFGAIEAPPDLYCAKETWYQVDINHLRATMRQVYEERQDYSAQCYEHVEQFSHQNIGNTIKQALLNG